MTSLFSTVIMAVLGAAALPQHVETGCGKSEDVCQETVNSTVFGIEKWNSLRKLSDSTPSFRRVSHGT